MDVHTKKFVLITDDCHHLLIENLTQMGYTVHFNPTISYAECCEVIAQYHGLVINSKIWVNKDFLDRASQLQWVGRLGSGMEIVDRPYAEAKGVAILSSPNGNCNAVSEHAVGMLLALSNQLLRADAEVRNFEWHREARRGWELEGKTIGIIGFGYTGTAFAQKWAGWNVRVLAYDKYLGAGYAEGYPYVKETDLPTLLAESDILSFHLPLTPETKYFAADRLYIDTKPGVVLINTSRGQVLRLQDLVHHLEQGRVGGACLDVFENEKVQSFTAAERLLYERLYKLPQVVLSPHIAGWTQESKVKMAQILSEKIKSL